MRENLIYILSTPFESVCPEFPYGIRNPSECYIDEEFEGKTKSLARFMIEKVPKKRIYVVLSQEGHSFPEILDAFSTRPAASDKLLEYALRYIYKKKEEEKELPLLINSKVKNNTFYNGDRFNRVKKRLERKI